jgi:hypothetical protein
LTNTVLSKKTTHFVEKTSNIQQQCFFATYQNSSQPGLDPFPEALSKITKRYEGNQTQKSAAAQSLQHVQIIRWHPPASSSKGRMFTKMFCALFTGSKTVHLITLLRAILQEAKKNGKKHGHQNSKTQEKWEEKWE